MRSMASKKCGFTLIELLIVIAIILILVAIALPNFLEAQIRAKVVRVRADLRTLATAMESYFQDWRIYPPQSEDEFDASAHGLSQLTTPLEYLPELPYDVFVGRQPAASDPGPGGGGVYFEMTSTGITPAHLLLPFISPALNANVHTYVIWSPGPNLVDNFNGEGDWPFHDGDGGPHPCPNPNAPPETGTTSYAPTNGTKSSGNIHQFGGEWRSGLWCLDHQVITGPGAHIRNRAG